MKKLMIFLMIAIPLVIIILVNFTVEVVIGNVSISVDRIELDKTEVIANIDDKISLEATIYPSNATNQEIIWVSTNENVARIDLDGNVTFVGFGNGYITATTADGNKMASCYFYVTDTAVHQVILTAPYTDVHVGTTVQLSATVLPNEAENKNVSFVSSDPTIAKVDQNGLVTGLKVGYVTITAVSEDGNYTDFVNLAIINPVSDIILNTDYAITGEDTYFIGYQIYPSNATNTSVEFTIDDPTVASVNSLGRVTFLKAGQVNVTLTTVDGGFSKTMTIVYTAGYAQSLTLEKYSISATIGDAAQVIEYSTVPSSLASTEVSFSSSNEDIAFVSNGYLYFVGGGTATITVKVEKSKGQYITQQIIVYVESPATGILIDDVVTAQKTVQLAPTSFPEDSTNNKFFYHSSSSNVSVSDSGLVTFLTDNHTTATITIFANNDYSDISTSIQVEYTAGKAKEFSLSENSLTLNYGQSKLIDYILFPSNADTKAIQLSILSQQNNSGEGDVIEVLPDGSIHGIGGGTATVEVSLVLINGEKKTETLQVTVLREIERIEIFIDLEQEDGVYITAENTVSFSAVSYPSDATNKNISWSVDDKSIAVILGETFKFNQTGTVTLIATSIGGLQEEVQVRYTGSYPISAEVGILTDNGVEIMPSQISVGESYIIAIRNIFPSNTMNKNITLKVSNQSTSSPLGKVLQVNGNTLTAIAGGKATLTVYVSATVVLTYEIEVYQKVESIEISPSNIQTTNSSIELDAIVKPIDATNKNVIFEVLNPELAYIEGNILYFLKDGVVEILARSEDNQQATYSFTIEKIAKGTGTIDPDLDEIEMFVGDSNKLDFSGQGIDYNQIEIVFAEGANQDVLIIDGETIIAVANGETEIVCYLYDQFGSPIKSYQIKIIISQLVENIIYSGDIEQYNEYLTTAKEEVDLTFSAMPSSASNVDFNFSIVSSYNSNGVSESIAYINGGKLYWAKSGTLTLKVSSADGNCSKNFNFRYTGGDALDAEINIDDEISLNVGESIKVEVEKWVPYDTTNKQILIREINHTTGVNVVSIDSGNLTITALSGGYSQIIIELSNGITKNIKINVIKKVSSIQVSEENIVTALAQATINASVLPSTATNKNLSYSMPKVDFATLDGNKVIFTSAGTVVVTISTMDGSNLTKQVTVTSTMGYLYSLTLNAQEKTISKNSSFTLYVTQMQPANATNKDIQYKIVSQNSADGSDNDVISLTQSGDKWLIQGLYGGTATVRIYTLNSLGQEIYSDCIITVSSPVEKIEIDFGQGLEFYQNYYVTSKNQISFEELVYPLDATNRNFVYTVSDKSKATVEKGLITFNEIGTVTITFTSEDTTNGVKSVSYIFYYAGDTLIEASLDTSSFENNILTMQAGEEKKLVLNKVVPSDNANVEITIKNLVEQRNDSQKAVIEFEDGVIRALNGGQATFDIYANNINLGSYTVKVERKATSISVESQEVFVSSPGYQINATVLPSDANDKLLTYSSSNPSIATVDDYGAVEFSGLGKVTITISLKNDSSIKKQITIEYTKEIKSISFTDTKDKMYVNEYVNLTVLPYPIDAEGFTYTFSLDNAQIASLTKVSDGTYRLRGLKEGEVTVTLKVDNTDIFYSKTFTFFTKLNDIKLELDEVEDSYGFGGYRVFGNKFISSTGKQTNSYVMNYSTYPNDDDYSSLIEWSTSNSKIASVNQNGEITFYGTGIVTITARQIAPYDGANVVSDSYTFYVVDGYNVYNYSQYLVAVGLAKTSNENKTNNYSAIVLQGDIIIEKTLENHDVNFNIYGNGYMIDFTNDTAYVKMNVTRSNIVIDNAILRGTSFSSEGELAELDGKGKVLLITNHATNVLIYNTIIENAFITTEVLSAQATFKGCIIRNSYSGGLVINRIKNDTVASDVTVEDCIFSRNLLSCICFTPDESSKLEGYESKLTIVGDLRLYNWLTLDEFQGDSILGFFEDYGAGDMVDRVIAKLKDIIRTNYTDYKYTIGDKDYYLFGIVDIYAILNGIVEFQSNAIIDKGQLNTKFNYADANLTGSIKEAIFIVDFDFKLLTATNNNPYIKPETTYEGDQVILAETRQPRRDEDLGFLN